MKVKIEDYSECTFWAVGCPECGEMIEVMDKTDNEIECQHCDKWFEVEM